MGLQNVTAECALLLICSVYADFIAYYTTFVLPCEKQTLSQASNALQRSVSLGAFPRKINLFHNADIDAIINVPITAV